VQASANESVVQASANESVVQASASESHYSTTSVNRLYVSILLACGYAQAKRRNN
jgi:hypothetical protein